MSDLITVKYVANEDKCCQLLAAFHYVILNVWQVKSQLTSGIRYSTVLGSDRRSEMAPKLIPSDRRKPKD